MKNVFENSMVAHVWNAQTQSAGRSGNGNFYFRDSMLFSYRDSWLVAKIMDDGVALHNADSYSISTSRHASYAWRASSNRIRFDVVGLNDLWSRDFESSYVKKHLLENARTMSSDSAHYLLKRIGEKNPESRWVKIQTERARLDAAEKASNESIKEKSLLADATKIGNATDAEINEMLARHCNKGANGIATCATRLYHVHRAAKKRKRNVQASRVFEVLTLARKIIKLDEVKKRVAERKHGFVQARNRFEGALSRVNSAEIVTSRLLDDVDTYGTRLLDYVPHFKVATRESISALVASAQTQSSYQEIIERAEAERVARVQHESWLSGDRTARLPYTYSSATLLRALDVTRDESGKITGGTLQTSRNAEVPLVHAIRAFRFVKLCKENARTWTRNGHSLRVGHFTVDHVAANGDFTAGCHNIGWNEVERVARLLGVFDCPASDDALTPSHEAA